MADLLRTHHPAAAVATSLGIVTQRPTSRTLNLVPPGWREAYKGETRFVSDAGWTPLRLADPVASPERSWYAEPMSSARHPAVAAAPTAHFTRDTAVDRVGPGRYGATLRDEWSLVHPQGGIVAVVGLRAMLAELDLPAQRLRSITTVFAAQVRSGPVEIDVTMLRRGRSMSQLSAIVRNPGEPAGAVVVAVFGVAIALSAGGRWPAPRPRAGASRRTVDRTCAVGLAGTHWRERSPPARARGTGAGESSAKRKEEGGSTWVA